MAAARARGGRDVVDAPPRYDAYFGLIVISLAATLTGLLFLYLDYSSYKEPPKQVPKAAAGGGMGAGQPGGKG